jgi:hypothetical protein
LRSLVVPVSILMPRRMSRNGIGHVLVVAPEPVDPPHTPRVSSSRHASNKPRSRGACKGGSPLATLGFASAAYAGSNYGPRHNGTGTDLGLQIPLTLCAGAILWRGTAWLGPPLLFNASASISRRTNGPPMPSECGGPIPASE